MLLVSNVRTARYTGLEGVAQLRSRGRSLVVIHSRGWLVTGNGMVAEFLLVD